MKSFKDIAKNLVELEKGPGELFYKLPVNPSEIDKDKFQLLIDFSKKFKNVDDASKLNQFLSELKKNGLFPNEVILRQVMSFLINKGQFNDAYALYEKVMIPYNIIGTDNHFILLNHAINTQQQKIIWDIFTNIKKFGVSSEKGMLDLIKYYRANKRYDELWQVFEYAMKTQTLTNDALAEVIFCLPMIDNKQKRNQVIQALNTICPVVTKSNISIFNYAISVLFDINYVNEAKIMYEKVRNAGMADAKTYFHVIKYLGKKKMLGEAWNIYMLARKSNQLNAHVVSHMMHLLSQNNEIDKLMDAFNDVNFLDELNEFSYGALIECLGKLNRLDDAEKVYQKMLKIGYNKNDNGILNSYLNILVSNNQIEKAKKVYSDANVNLVQTIENGELVVDLHGLSFGSAYIALSNLLDDLIKQDKLNKPIVIIHGNKNNTKEGSNGETSIDKALEKIEADRKEIKSIDLIKNAYKKGRSRVSFYPQQQLIENKKPAPAPAINPPEKLPEMKSAQTPKSSPILTQKQKQKQEQLKEGDFANPSTKKSKLKNQNQEINLTDQVQLSKDTKEKSEKSVGTNEASEKKSNTIENIHEINAKKSDTTNTDKTAKAKNKDKINKKNQNNVNVSSNSKPVDTGTDKHSKKHPKQPSESSSPKPGRKPTSSLATNYFTLFKVTVALGVTITTSAACFFLSKNK